MFAFVCVYVCVCDTVFEVSLCLSEVCSSVFNMIAVRVCLWHILHMQS